MGTHLVELLRKIGASPDELPMELPRSSEIDGKNFERSMLTSQLQARCKAIGNGIGNGKMTAILSSNLTPIRGLTGERASVVLFGDSLTQRGWSEGGWCSSVADLFRRRADVYNRGYGGYNSRWARYLLPHMFPLADDSPAKKHFLVVVWFGTNDALHPSQNSHVPLEEYVENVRAILAHVQQVRRCLKAIGSLCLFHVPLEEYAENVRAILAHVQEVRRCLKAIGSLCLFHPRTCRWRNTSKTCGPF